MGVLRSIIILNQNFNNMENSLNCNASSGNFQSSRPIKLKGKTAPTFRCKYCSKLLSSKQNLKEHEFIHTGVLPYICKVTGCGLRFKQGSLLSSHKRIHKTIEKYLDQKKCKWVKVLVT